MGLTKEGREILKERLRKNFVWQGIYTFKADGSIHHDLEAGADEALEQIVDEELGRFEFFPELAEHYGIAEHYSIED